MPIFDSPRPGKRPGHPLHKYGRGKGAVRYLTARQTGILYCRVLLLLSTREE